jgi:hypothetical protein
MLKILKNTNLLYISPMLDGLESTQLAFSILYAQKNTYPILVYKIYFSWLGRKCRLKIVIIILHNIVL